MKSTINLKYICIKPRPQCHFLFASFVHSFILLTLSVFLSFGFWNTLVKQNKDSNIIVHCFVFNTFIFNVNSNCSASISSIKVPLEKKKNQCMLPEETKEVYLDGELLD